MLAKQVEKMLPPILSQRNGVQDAQQFGKLFKSDHAVLLGTRSKLPSLAADPNKKTPHIFHLRDAPHRELWESYPKYTLPKHSI